MHVFHSGFGKYKKNARRIIIVRRDFTEQTLCFHSKLFTIISYVYVFIRLLSPVERRCRGPVSSVAVRRHEQVRRREAVQGMEAQGGFKMGLGRYTQTAHLKQKAGAWCELGPRITKDKKPRHYVPRCEIHSTVQGAQFKEHKTGTYIGSP
jgi:hypothetical protein